MFVIAHLSDIHLADPLDPILARASLVARAIGAASVDCNDVILAITGDIAFSGKSDQYDLAITFFREIEDLLKVDYHLKVHYAVCPGNHDCDFSLDQEFRDLALTGIFSETKPSKRAINECTAVQAEFFQFLKELCGVVPSTPEQKLRYEIEVSTSDGPVTFDCINLSWVSRLSEEKVTFPSEIVPERKSSPGLRVTIFHHPFNWLHPSSYRSFRKRVRSGADLLLTGHEHEWAVVETFDSDSGASLQIEGGVLQDRKQPDFSNFSVLLIDSSREKYKAQKFDLHEDIYSGRGDKGWVSFRPLRIAATEGVWRSSEAFESELSDLGMSLSVMGGREMALEDIFVFPDLQYTPSTGEKIDSITTLEDLLKASETQKGFVIQGDERSGKTSLVKQLIRRSFNMGIVPLLLSGGDLRRAADDEVDRLIKREFERQLEGGSLEAYRQLPVENKIIFIDDIDESPIRSEKVIARLLERMRARCGRLVATAGEAFEATQIVSDSATGVLAKLPTFHIQQFGYLARTRLIKKWTFLNVDETHSEDDRVSLIHDTENFISGVLNRGVVPAYPIYLLALLHAENARKEDALQEGGFGHYYEYLISQAMIDAGIHKDKLDEIYSYCTQLAWFLMRDDDSYISFERFKEFNAEFSRTWLTVEFSSRCKELIKARLIVVNGDRVEFRYPYLQYYFVARYLAENLDEPEVMAYIRESAQRLYVRSRSNALVFLTHFTTRQDVIDVILSALGNQFADVRIVQFNNQNESVEALLKELPMLTYRGGDPLQHREDESRQKDKRPEDDGLLEKPERSDALSVSSRLACVFRAIEIVGQILKVRYSKFKRPRKEAMVNEVITAPLRALEDFYSLLRQQPGALIAEFRAAAAETNDGLSKSEMEKLAMKIAGVVVLAVSFGFVKKIADALSADVIRENLASVVGASDDLAYKLVGLACSLDGQRPLPRAEIERVLRLGKGSLVVDNLVKLFVIYRMRMFRTTASDIQWAKDVLHIPMHVQVQAMLKTVK